MQRFFLIAIWLFTAGLSAQQNGNNSGPEASKADKLANSPVKMDYQADRFTGRFVYSVPIEVPPARHGSEPNLALHYNSAGESTWCGVGWDLDLGYIQRETRKGVPVQWNSSGYPLAQYDDKKGFLFSLNGHSSSLVPVGGNEFRAEIEGAFLRFNFLTNSGSNCWVVTDKTGNQYFFGTDSVSRMVNPKSASGWSQIYASGTFRWALSRVVTVKGDTTDISYTTFNGGLYPLTLAYNGSTVAGGLTNSHTVDFQLEDRTDKRRAYNSGFRVELGKRLTNIIVKVNGQLVRRYQLAFTNSTSTSRSLLSSVTLYGNDNLTNLPPLRFNYSAQAFQFESGVSPTWLRWTNLFRPVTTVTWQPPFGYDNTYASAGFPSQCSDVIDMNGDGLPDRLLQPTNSNSSAASNCLVQFNNGTGFANPGLYAVLQNQGKTGSSSDLWGFINSMYLRFIDINGDGLPDRVMDPASVVSNKYYTSFVVALNNGRGFASESTWTNVLPSYPDTTDYSFLAVESPASVKMVDMNGDGLPDRLMRGSQGIGTGKPPFTNCWVQFNTGGGFTRPYCFGPYYSQGHSADFGWDVFNSQNVRIIDINGDGLPDRVMRPTNYVGSQNLATFTNFVVEFNNGYGFEPATNWLGVNPLTNGLACEVQDGAYAVLRDINGDGLPDRVVCPSVNPSTWFAQLNTGFGFSPPIQFGPVASQGTGIPDYAAIESAWNTFMDINGDGLPDRVLTANPTNSPSNPYFVVELSKGPFPDLLTGVGNGIGGSLTVSYSPSTRYNNRATTNANETLSLLPFPIYTVASLSSSDGLYSANTTSFSYTGGMWNASRREFNGFATVTTTNPMGDSVTEWFHQAGGRDQSVLGESLDNTTNVLGKKGMPFRIETRGTNGQLYKLELNRVDDVALVGSRHFAYVGQTIEVDYPGNGSAGRATARQFQYDTNNGNLTGTIEFGEVNGVNQSTHEFTDMGDDVVGHFNTYATLTNPDILDKVQRTVTTADAEGQTILRETLFDYDGNTGNLMREFYRICANTYSSNCFSYDNYGNRQWETNEAGIVTQWSYDNAYKTFPIQQTVAGTFTSSSLFDPRSGTLLSSTDPKGLVTSNSLDAFFRPTDIWISVSPTNPQASLWTARYAYNLGGVSGGACFNSVRLRRNDGVDSVNGHETWTYFDGLGRARQVRVQSETNNSYRVVDTAFDQGGNRIFETQPYFANGSTYGIPTGSLLGTTYGFDPIQRLTSVTPCVSGTFASGLLTSLGAAAGDTDSPVGTASVDYQYNNDPWVLVVTDAATKQKRFYLDAYGRTNQIVEVAGGSDYTTRLGWNKVGDLLGITNHQSDVIEFAYNDLGQVVAMSDPNMGIWEYRRDIAGRIHRQIDANNNQVLFDYNDSLGRLSSRQVFNPQNVLVGGVTNVYDSNGGDDTYSVFPGQLFMTSDNQGWEKFSWDLRGRTLKKTRLLAKNNTTYVTQFGYDDGDHVIGITYPNGGPTVTNTYFAGGILRNVQRIDGGGNPVFYQSGGYNSFGQSVGGTFANGVTTKLRYFDNTKRLQQCQTTKQSTTLQQLNYSFDKVANLKGITDGVYSGNDSAGLSNIEYDHLHRLTSLTRPGAQATTFSYSPIGNLTANGENGGGNYNYGVRMPHAVKSANGKFYGYDLSGNMILRGSQQLDYDSENRLVQVKNTGTNVYTITFGYSGNGERLWKQGTNSLQVWIGGIYEEKNGKTLFHISAGDLLVCSYSADGSVLEYCHADHLRSTSILTDGSGSQVQHYEYSAFGRSRYTQSGTAFPVSKRYTHQVLDEETGLYYYGARYYDPELARFAQPDTIIPDVFNPQSYNRYSYVMNNPLKYVDPTGHDPAFMPGMSMLQNLSVQERYEVSRVMAPYAVGTTVALATGGLAAPALASAGASSAFVAIGSGIVAGTTGDLATQGTQIGMGQRNSIDTQEVAVSGLVGAASSYGLNRAFAIKGIPEPVAEPVQRTGPKGTVSGHHNANVTVRDSSGRIVKHTRIVSGNMTAEEKALGFPKNTLATHTEARAVNQVPLKEGQSMTITGQRPPCPPCKGVMNKAAAESGGTIKYQWREGGSTQKWEAN